MRSVVKCFSSYILNLFYELTCEPVHDKLYNKTRATSKDSDQAAHSRSLIRVFADRICLLQPLGYPEMDKEALLPYLVDVQVDMRFCW